MKILLDENFPMQLYRRLRSAGYDTEHIIVLGQRGIKDSAIRARVASENRRYRLCAIDPRAIKLKDRWG